MADNANCFELGSDPEVIRFVAVPWSDEAEHQAFIEARTRGPYPFGQGYWTVRRKSEPTRFLGWILLTPLDACTRELTKPLKNRLNIDFAITTRRSIVRSIFGRVEGRDRVCVAITKMNLKKYFFGASTNR